MGHTLVTAFDEAGYNKISQCLGGVPTNNIPFGRDGDRNQANEVLDYHMTLIHWGADADSIFLPLVDKISFSPCKIEVTGANIMPDYDGSLLYFNVRPAEGYNDLAMEIMDKTGLPAAPFMHITLAVDADNDYILGLKESVEHNSAFPFTLNVTGLDLYKIWNPVKLVKRIQ